MGPSKNMRVAGAVATITLAACRGPTPGLTEVVYTGAWDVSGIQVYPDHWTVHTPTGAMVSVTRAYLSTRAAVLVPCDGQASRWSPVAAAWAGHGVEHDASLMRPGVVEDLARPADSEWGTVRFPEQRYCSAHVLLGFAEAEAHNLPADVAMVGTTLWLDASVEQGEVHRDIRVQTYLAHAHMEPLDLDGGTATVVATRHLGPLFDGIDFRADNDATVAWRVLDNLSKNTTVTVR